MINKKIAKLILEESLKTGADFAELYIENNVNHNIHYENSATEYITYNTSYGVGLRILKDNTSVYGYTNVVNKKTLIKLANKLNIYFKDNIEKNNIQESAKKISHTNFINKKNKNISPIHCSYFSTPIQKKIDILKLASKTITNYSPFIKQATCIFNATQKKVKIYNSNGLCCYKKQEYIRLIMQATANNKDQHEINFECPSIQNDMMYFLKMDIKKIATNIASDAINILNAAPCPSGKMTVVINNGFGGVLFHEACGHALEASSVSHNLSVFTHKLNQQIASPLVNAYDDGTIPYAFGSNDFDDEGNQTQKICLIKNGKLVNYLIDNFNGRRMHCNGNGACRRQNYQYEPTSRMSNTFIDNGTSKVEDIIKNTKLGLYAKKLGGGSVNPITGEFEFAVSIGYIIRDGHIAEQVKGAILIGKSEEILKNIDMIGNDLQRSQGICGASSGNIPVEVGQPTIRIKQILVGGQGKSL